MASLTTLTRDQVTNILMKRGKVHQFPLAASVQQEEIPWSGTGAPKTGCCGPSKMSIYASMRTLMRKVEGLEFPFY